MIEKQKLCMHRVVISSLFARHNVTVSATLLGEGLLDDTQCSFKEIPVTLHNSEKTSHYP